jgi:hypothetical protein
LVSGGSSWEKARQCTQADPTIPLSLQRKPLQDSPITAFSYPEHLSTQFWNMQVIFHALTKIELRDMVTLAN